MQNRGYGYLYPLKVIAMKKIILIAVFFASCKQNTNDSNKTGIQVDSKDSLISTIAGKWGDRNGNPGWLITKDSLYYFNEKKSYYYLIHDKDMIVLYKEGPFMMGNVHVLRDTLFFTIPNGGTIKAFKIR